MARVALIAAALSSPGALAADGRVEVVEVGGRIIATFSVQPGESWCLKWNHSVAGFTVSDCFVFRDGKMILDSSHQPDFAAGLGHIVGRGAIRVDARGGYLIENIDEAVSDNRLRLRVGTVAVDHRLRFNGRELSLSALAANRVVELRLRP